MRTLSIALVSILLSVAAQFSLKAGMSSESVRQSLVLPFSARTIIAVMGNPKILGGFVLYGLGAVAWLAVLSKWDVSKAYPMVGLGFVLTAGIGFLAGEQVTLSRFAGVALICAGILVIGRS